MKSLFLGKDFVHTRTRKFKLILTFQRMLKAEIVMEMNAASKWIPAKLREICEAWNR
jgi:hypothetical protein